MYLTATHTRSHARFRQGAASEGWESLESALDDMEAAMVACLPEEAFDLASRIDGARLIAAAQREAAEAAEWE